MNQEQDHLKLEAKAEALREAADAMTRKSPGNGPWGTPAYEHHANWLRERAADLTKPDHAA